MIPRERFEYSILRRMQNLWLTVDPTRRTSFFGMDLGVAALHLGRSLLGQEALDLGDAFLKSVSLEYCSLESVVRDEATDALRK